MPAEMRADTLQRLLKKARDLPRTPGVYLLKDAQGRVLYVGKATRLCDRVSSYFLASTDLGPKKQPMLDLVADFDVIECETEWESLLSENRLIKDIRPRFNTLLVDDKTFPYLAVTLRDAFPGVYITRNPSDPQFKGARFFGPFTSAYALYDAVQILQRIFKYRTCSLDIIPNHPKNRSFRPCLLHVIGQCTAPCADRVTEEAYREDIRRFTRFLESKRSVMLRELRQEMEEASAAMEFERAAVLRDQIHAIEKLEDRGRFSDGWQPEAEMLVGIDPKKGLASLARTLAPFRTSPLAPGSAGGQHSGSESLPNRSHPPAEPGANGSHPPAEPGANGSDPPAEPGANGSDPPAEPGANGPIRCIEAIDIAHLQGDETVGSKVCFIDGKPFKNEYRRYRIHTAGNDDYAALREVVLRRYREAGQGQELYPDVILIDGGLGQLHAAMEAFDSLDVRPPMVVALAKKEELLYVQRRSEPIRLGRENLGLRLCQAIRDEAHRFAQHYHHILRRKKTLGEGKRGRRTRGPARPTADPASPPPA